MVKLAPGTALEVEWLPIENEPAMSLGRLAMAQGRAQLEWAAPVMGQSRDFSALYYPPEPGLIAARTNTFAGLHGFLADSLPDAWGMLLLKRQLQKLGHDIDTLDAVDRLALVGATGRGALVFRPASFEAAETEPIDLDLVARESARVLEGEDSDLAAWLARLGGGSGGARPKAHIAYYDDGSIGAGDDPEREATSEWIVKFRARSDPIDIGPVEQAYADMARACGLHVEESKLLPAADGPGYFATRRFDRPEPGKRVHMVSLGGAIEASPDIPSIDYDGFLKAVHAITRDVRDVEKAFRRMVFNVLAINRDDHVRQHAFLMAEDGTWRLGPAYDLTYSSGPGGEHYLAVEGEGRDITSAHVTALGKKHGVADGRIAQIVDDVRSGISRWEDFAKSSNVTASIAEISESLVRRDREFREGR